MLSTVSPSAHPHPAFFNTNGHGVLDAAHRPRWKSADAHFAAGPHAGGRGLPVAGAPRLPTRQKTTACPEAAPPFPTRLSWHTLKSSLLLSRLACAQASALAARCLAATAVSLTGVPAPACPAKPKTRRSRGATRSTIRPARPLRTSPAVSEPTRASGARLTTRMLCTVSCSACSLLQLQCTRSRGKMWSWPDG